MKIQSILLAMCIVSSCLAHAQTDTQGAILGTVTDPSGAVVRGAKVTATSTATGIATSDTTSEHGSYRFSLLKPGSYGISVEANGFSRAEIGGILLSVGDAHRSDVRLQVGSENQSVTVSSTSANINTENAERGDVIGSEEIENLPLNGRQFLQLAALEPGSVSGNPKRGIYSSKGVDVSFNGARGGYNSYYIDGAANTDPLYNQLQASPSLDAISEFRVSTNMYSAQYGRAGGAVVSIVTKSGENNFHGTAYEYHRNKVLDALPYFYTGARGDLANYLLNQYGGTIGGPIVKNRTFFFFSTEFYHQVKPSQEIVTFAPTDAERSGDVSHTINPFSMQPVQLMNPYTHQPIPSNVLPSSLVNPVSKTLMSLWPKPNYAGDPFLNLHLFRGGAFTQKKYLGRVDHKLFSKDSLSATFDFDDYDNVAPEDTVYGDTDQADHNRTWVGSWTHPFTSNLVNDLKSSFASFQSGSQFALDDKNYCASWGFSATVNKLAGTCRILLYTVGYQRFDIGNDGDYKHHNYSFYAKDNLILAKGKHTLTFGGEYSRDQYSWQFDAGTAAYYFGVYEGLPGYDGYYGVTGSTFTDVLMGISNYMYVGLGGTVGSLDMHLLRNVLGGYAQDDWKISHKLTLNLGLRYDYEQPFADQDNEFMTLDYATGLPRYAKGAPQSLLNLVQFKYETGGPNRPYEPHTRNFSPRIGFAFRPSDDNRTAIRGGYGSFYTTENAFTTMYGSWVAPFQGLVYSTPAYAASWPDNQEHLTTVDQTPYGLDYLRGASPGSFQPNADYYPSSYVEQWNLTIDRDLGSMWGFEIGYVGSHGVNLNGPQSLQTYNPSTYTKALANKFSNFPVQTKGFSSSYNAMQATLHKRSSHGLDMLTSYTFSHALAQASDDASTEGLVSDPTANGNISEKLWSNADFDVRQRLTISEGYELPFGHGKTWGHHWNKVVDGVAGGWRTNLIYTYQSGFPFSVFTSGLLLPDRTCSGVLPKGKRTAWTWFDYTCFPTHTPTTYVDPVTGKSSLINTQGNSRQNVIYGPPTNDVDFGMQKYIHLSEHGMLQIRAEAFNLFNHPNWTSPSSNYFFNSASGTAITNARDGRDIQVAARIIF